MKYSKSLAAFASDLGGGSQLYYFVRNNTIFKNYKKFFFLKGDSKSLIKKYKNESKIDNLDYDLIICSTSGNNYEKKIIYEALKKKKEVWVIFDNWTNYTDRLSYKGEVLFVSKIIVTDKYAHELANKYYKKHLIEIHPNYYLEHLKKVKMKKKKKRKEKNIVFFSSPENYFYHNESSRNYRKSWEKEERENLENEIKFILNSDFLKLDLNYSLHLRLHPQLNFLRNDKDFIYKDLIESEDKKLEISISYTDVSIGKDSYVLHLTSALKIPTYSILQGLYKRKFRIPYLINNLE